MRNRWLELFVIPTFLIWLVVPVNAQSNPKFDIRIPFDFVAPGGMLPAGVYTVERADPTRPNALKLRSTKTGKVRIFITQRVETNDLTDMACLVFKRSNTDYRLFQVWMVGSMTGNQLPAVESSRSQNRTISLVRLKSNDSKP